MSNQYAEVESMYDGFSSTLASSVEHAVASYLDALNDQRVTDLYELVLSQVEAPLIECVLEYTENNQSRTAAILGLNRGTLRKKLKKYKML
ncbi:MAG: DNA-binding transcriptional regulator Fis [Pseudomonadales bacterium]|nr:DNA-binding transcriptional regulator Fis [Pseudomonadales bacterium]